MLFSFPKGFGEESKQQENWASGSGEQEGKNIIHWSRTSDTRGENIVVGEQLR